MSEETTVSADTVTEDHRLTLFCDVLVRIEINKDGDAAIFFEAVGNTAEERDYPLTFNADGWAEVKAFWDSVTHAD